MVDVNGIPHVQNMQCKHSRLKECCEGDMPQQKECYAVTHGVRAVLIYPLLKK